MRLCRRVYLINIIKKHPNDMRKHTLLLHEKKEPEN